MKLWKKLLAFAAVLLMVFSFAACDSGVIESEWDGNNLPNKIHQSTDGTQQETEPLPTDPNEVIYGTWVKEMDISEPFIAGMENSLSGMIEIPQMPIYVVLKLEFQSDGLMTASFKLDEATFGEFAEAVSVNMRAYIMDAFAAMGLSGKDVELYCQDTFGVSLDAYMADFVDTMTDAIVAEFPSIEMQMYYELEGTKLWLAKSADGLAEASDYMTLSVEDGLMVIKRLGGKEITQLQTVMEEYGEDLPWTLLKK